MQLGHLPRVQLATLPTPIEYMDNLSKSLGGPQILIKRDDLTGLATGGNKTRKLEFLLGDAVFKKADVIVTGANPQSNHVRQTSAAARKLGLDVVLVLSDEEPPEINGNLLLDKIFGAELRFVGGAEADLGPKMEQVAQELIDNGRRPYIIERFGSVPIGTLGYINALIELVNQINHQQISIDHVIVAGGGGTYAGLFLGAITMRTGFDVIGIAISKRTIDWKDIVLDLVIETADYLKMESSIQPNDINVLTDYDIMSKLFMSA